MVIFSHGLGGNRGVYSEIAAEVASHVSEAPPVRFLHALRVTCDTVTWKQRLLRGSGVWQWELIRADTYVEAMLQTICAGTDNKMQPM